MRGSSLIPKIDVRAGRLARAPSGTPWTSFILFQSVYWGIFFLIRALASAQIYPEHLWTYMGPRVILVLAYAVLTTLAHLVASRFQHWKPRERLLLVLGLCALMLFPLHRAEMALTRTISPDWPAQRFIDYLSGFGWVLVAWAGYYYALDYAREVRRQAEALSQAQALAHATQIKMLRYQLNPHFLFNSLNAISTLVLEGRNHEAEGMLLRLSRFLRHTIDTDPTQLARLGDEAVLQRLYLEMETVRFAERLRVDCDVPESLHDCLVPSLLLQPIVENAIKHGVSKAAQGGLVSIRARAENDRLLLEVENDGPPFIQGASGRGLGLRNSRDRIAAIYGADAEMSVSARPQGGALVVFNLPLRRAQSGDSPHAPRSDAADPAFAV